MAGKRQTGGKACRSKLYGRSVARVGGVEWCIPRLLIAIVHESGAGWRRDDGTRVGIDGIRHVCPHERGERRGA